MLVLTRKLGESIVIGDDVVIKVTAIQGNRVKISLDAPQSRRILRGEIADPPVNSPAPTAEDGGWSRAGTDTQRTSGVVTPPASAK
ncbi:MAG: carbon storage regulator [Planctomycetaceae bacterium]